jgi:predicted dehydrogenase
MQTFIEKPAQSNLSIPGELIVAVVGCGAIAREGHLPHYRAHPRVRLALLVDAEEALAREACEIFGVIRNARGIEKILGDPEINAVSLCVPPFLHHPMAKACLENGKHVLCEKPIALDLAQALELQATSKRVQRQLVIGLVNRYHAGVNLVKQAIERGDLGRVYHVECDFVAHRSIPGLGGWFTQKACSGGGVLSDWGVHFLDLISYCLGAPEAITASAVAHSVLGRDISDYAYTKMWAGPPRAGGSCDVEEQISGLVRTTGPTIAFTGAWARNIREERKVIDFLGDKGGIRLEYGGNFTVYSHRDGVLYESIPRFRAGDMYAAQIDGFVAGILDGTPNRASIDRVIGVQRLTDALYRSVDEHREIDLAGESHA